MNYMFYEYIGSFIYNRCAILFCGVNAPPLIPQVWPPGGLLPYGGWKEKNTEADLQCCIFVL
jgi:hypothetical protein